MQYLTRDTQLAISAGGSSAAAPPNYSQLPITMAGIGGNYGGTFYNGGNGAYSYTGLDLQNNYTGIPIINTTAGDGSTILTGTKYDKIYIAAWSKWYIMSSGQLYTSTDRGITYTTYLSGPANEPYSSIAAVYNGSKLVTWNPYSSGTQGIWITTDGTNWTNYSMPSSRIYAMCWNSTASKFVAYCVDGSIRNSSDAITWTTIATGLPTNPGGVTIVWKGNRYILAGAFNTAPKCYTSTDGITWTLRTTGGSGSATSVAYASGINGGTYAFATTSGEVITSTDAITWSVASLPISVAYNNSHKVEASNNLFVLSVQDATYNWRLLSSTNGTTWSSCADPDWNNGTSSSMAYTPIGGPIRPYYSSDLNTWMGLWHESSDGINWSPMVGLSAIAYNSSNNTYTAVGGQGSTWKSTDGKKWTYYKASSIVGRLYDIDYSPTLNRFVAVGYTPAGDGKIYYSNDGTTWNLVQTITGLKLLGVTWSSIHNIFIITTAAKLISTTYYTYLYFSSTGTSAFTQSTLYSSTDQVQVRDVYKIHYSTNNNNYVAVGDYGRMYSTSYNGTTFTTGTAVGPWINTGSLTGTRVIFESIICRNVSAGVDQWVAVGYVYNATIGSQSPIIFISSDGVNWTYQVGTTSITSGSNQTLSGVNLTLNYAPYGSLYDIKYSSTRNLYIAIGNGNVWTSGDGLTWTGRRPRLSSSYADVTVTGLGIT